MSLQVTGCKLTVKVKQLAHHYTCSQRICVFTEIYKDDFEVLAPSNLTKIVPENGVGGYVPRARIGSTRDYLTASKCRVIKPAAKGDPCEFLKIQAVML